MSDPVLHIKDGYFFEVPRALWRQNYATREDVPKFLRDAHPHATVAEFNAALDGKILIPQPFGTPKNLYESASGFCISKFMILELVVAVILVVLFTRLAKQVRDGSLPRGRLFGMLEVMMLYMRDNVARPAIGEHDADRFVPLLWTIFFFILGCNLFGLVPWAGTATGAFGTTLALAGVVICTTIGSGIKKFGPIGFWLNQVPSMDLPFYMSPLKLPIFVIEVVGMLIRHGVLAVRLLANMAAGHMVLLGILGLTAGLAGASFGKWALVSSIAVGGSAAFSCLELFVGFCRHTYLHFCRPCSSELPTIITRSCFVVVPGLIAEKRGSGGRFTSCKKGESIRELRR